MNDYLPYIPRYEDDAPIKWALFRSKHCGEFLTVILHVLDDPFEEEAGKSQWVFSIIAENKEKELLLMLDATSLEGLVNAPEDQTEHLICIAEASPPNVSNQNSYVEIVRESSKTNLCIKKYNEATGQVETITLNDMHPNKEGDSFEHFILKSYQELIDHGNAIYGNINNNSPER